MVDHITKIHETRDRLAAIGEVINDKHLASLMLCSQPPSYDVLITALEARDEQQLRATFIRSKLTDEYLKRVENKNESESSHSVYKVKNQKSKLNKHCKYCKKVLYNR